MIAPNYWVDYKTGNDYYVTVQYFEHGSGAIHNLVDLSQMPLRAPALTKPTTLDAVASVKRIETPTEIDHYQIKRVMDVYVSPSGEDLGNVTKSIQKVIADTKIPEGMLVDLHGMVEGMFASFKSFGFGFTLSFILLFLILVAQFRSFIDPFLIMLAIPMASSACSSFCRSPTAPSTSCR